MSFAGRLTQEAMDKKLEEIIRLLNKLIEIEDKTLGCGGEEDLKKAPP